ncbi:MAG: hypothetical protein JWR47_1167 [Phenylobacterium sp.]|nr:hypothetical protein [Phenylobacterium sp.]
MTESQLSPMRGFVASAMIAVGMLLVALCGTCSAFFAISALADILTRGLHSGGEFSSVSVLQVTPVFGGPPILVGAALIWGGLRLRRAPKPPPASPPRR